MTNYNDEYKNIDCIYENENLSQTLGEVLEQNKRTQIRIAETEKYPHVTFFFNGGKNHLLRMKQESCVHLQKLQLMI